MSSALLDLLQRQQRDGFPDVAGSEVAATSPVSDSLLNELIATLLSNGGTVREIRVRLEESNRVTAEIRVSRPRFLPTISVRVAIEDQPELPASNARAQTDGTVRSTRARGPSSSTSARGFVRRRAGQSLPSEYAPVAICVVCVVCGLRSVLCVLSVHLVGERVHVEDRHVLVLCLHGLADVSRDAASAAPAASLTPRTKPQQSRLLRRESQNS
jgi:hypothetical protein